MGTSGEFPYAATLTRSDNENHAPGTQPKWQESTLVALVDPQRGLAAFHRIGIHPNRNEASLYSWTQIDGKIVSRAKRTGLPIPRGPLTGASLEGVTFQTLIHCAAAASRWTGMGFGPTYCSNPLPVPCR